MNISGEVARTRRWLIVLYVLAGAAGTPILYKLFGEAGLYGAAFALIIMFCILLLSMKASVSFTADDDSITFAETSGRTRTVSLKEIVGTQFKSSVSSVYRDAYHKCITGHISFKAGGKRYSFTSEVLAEGNLVKNSDVGFKATENELDTKKLYDHIKERTS